MTQIKSLFVFLFLLFNVGCGNQKKVETTELSLEEENEINHYLATELENTLGLAVAVVKNGNVVYGNYFGKENLRDQPVTKESVFPLYSLSKLITSTAVFQLIEKNKIRLDDKITLYIDSLPEEWRDIEIKHLLSHSSGLPDYDVMKGSISDSITMRNLVQERLRYRKGERWEYNQTNFWFITKIIEQVTNMSYESFVIENQFSNNSILFSSNFIDPIPHRSFKYNFNNETQSWEKIKFDFGKRANSAGGISLTLNQFVKWSNQFDQNEFIQPETKGKMWAPFEYETPFYFENEKDKFLYGWQQYSTNNEVSYGFTGGMVTGYRKFINQNMTIIVLTNGLKNTPIRNKVINKIAGIVDENLVEKNE